MANDAFERCANNLSQDPRFTRFQFVNGAVALATLEFVLTRLHKRDDSQC